MTPFAKLFIPVVGGLAALNLATAGFAAWKAARADVWKERAESREAVILTLENSLATALAAHEREIEAARARAQSGESARRTLERLASEAERALIEARRNNAKLDECLRADFGVDLSGGLLTFPARDNRPED